jgi:hypothetical protein
MTTTTDITTTAIIAWSAPSPSSPAPAARRCAALELDRSPRPSKLADRAADESLSMFENENQPSQKSLTQNFRHSLKASGLRQPPNPRVNKILRYAPIVDWTLLSLFAVNSVAKPFK